MMNALLRATVTTVVLGGLCLTAAVPAGAGVVDSPLPTLSSSGHTSHVFTVPGVIRNNQLETIFMCTSLEKTKTVMVAVEVFAAAGGSPLNDAGQPALEGVETLLPGETRTIATGATVAFHEDNLMGGALAPASLRNGSARIVSTSKKIACSAFVVDDLNVPPVTMGALKILSKKKQRGE